MIFVIVDEHTYISVTPCEQYALRAYPTAKARKNFGERLAASDFFICYVCQFFDAAAQLFAYLRSDETGEFVFEIEIFVKLYGTYLYYLIDETFGFAGVCIVPFEIHYYKIHRNIL